MAMSDNNYISHTINYFRKHYVTDGIEINYKSFEVGVNTVLKFKIPKEEYTSLTLKLREDDIDFEVIPSDRKMELDFPQHNGKKLLKTKFFKIEIFFVEAASLKNVESIANKKDLNIKNWSDFFDMIDPEYSNLMSRIVNGIPIATHKNEYGQCIARKRYWVDKKDGLFEKKEKLINEEWKITYKHVTNDIYHVFRMFFRHFEETSMNDLADLEFFKTLVEKTKYKTHLRINNE